MSPRHARPTFDVDALEEAEADRRRFKNAGLAPLTIASYERDWRVFTAWCEAAHRVPLPASTDTVELYMVDQLRRGRRVTTLRRHAIGIQHFHRMAGHASPCGQELRALLTGAQRILAQVPKQKEALTLDKVVRMAGAIGAYSPIAIRDRTLILFGFASALRRGNLAALDLEDLTFTEEGVRVAVRREKQDRKGRGRTLAICYAKNPRVCPVRALQKWLEVRGGAAGPVFCHVMKGKVLLKRMLGNRITQLVQEAAEAIGIDRRAVGCHSLRAGFVTSCINAGLPDLMVASHTNHRDLSTLQLYHRRPSSSFAGNPTALIDL